MSEPERVFEAENNNYHPLRILSVADDHAPAIVISGAQEYQDSYVISPATARALGADLIKRADEFEGVKP